MKYIVNRDITDNLLEIYLSKPEIAIDTEMHGLQLYRDEVCLVQICDDQKNVSLIKPDKKNVPPKLKILLSEPKVKKIFHFALTDVVFLKTSLNINVQPFRCTKVMSKLVRTYTQNHGLKDLSLELLGLVISKEQQQSNWGDENLSNKQLEYAAKDVLDLIQIYKKLEKMIEKRPPFISGTTVKELNDKAQAMLPVMVDLLANGYGDKNGGWETSLFSH